MLSSISSLAKPSQSTNPLLHDPLHTIAHPSSVFGQQFQSSSSSQPHSQAGPSTGPPWGQPGPSQPYGQQLQPQQQQLGQVQQYGQPSAPSYAGTSQQSSWNRGYTSYYSAPQTQLQPQQLESVGKDEDPVYGPLGRARGKIERALLSDSEISPDLADLLGAPGSSEISLPWAQ